MHAAGRRCPGRPDVEKMSETGHTRRARSEHNGPALPQTAVVKAISQGVRVGPTGDFRNERGRQSWRPWPRERSFKVSASPLMTVLMGLQQRPFGRPRSNRQFARQIGTLQMALLMPSVIDHIEKLFRKVQQEIGFRSGCVGTREFGLKGNFHLAKYAPVEQSFRRLVGWFRQLLGVKPRQFKCLTVRDVVVAIEAKRWPDWKQTTAVGSKPEPIHGLSRSMTRLRATTGLMRRTRVEQLSV